MQIAICSFFRDSQKQLGFPINQVEKYFTNLRIQKNIDPDDLSFHLVEGNSIDNTYEFLKKYQKSIPNITLIKYTIEGSSVASVVSDKRFKNLSTIGNLALNSAKASGAKYIFWMESDLIPQSDLLCRLLEYTKEEQWDSTLGICPVPIFDWDGYRKFYDTWAFEGSEGEKWGNDDLTKLTNYPQTLRPMKSFGSAALLNGNLLRKYEIDFGQGCFPELCQTGRSFGLKLFCDTSLRIIHPADRFIGGRLC